MPIIIFYIFSLMFQQSGWRVVSSEGPESRYINQMPVLDGKIFLFGGKHSSNDGYDDLWEWSEGRWTLIGKGPQKLWDHSIVSMDREDQLLLFGGRTMDGDERVDLSISWVFKDGSWSKLGGNSPPSRSSHAMEYFDQTREVFLFGGRSKDEVFGDFWVFDDSQWKQLKVPGPGPRYGHSMSFDRVSNKMYLFGGYNGEKLLNDFWSYDGENWEKIETENSPSPRMAHSMDFDVSGRAILLGGWDDSQKVQGDLWEWSDNKWSRLNFEIQPQARLSGALTFDPSDRSFLLFGGSGSFGDDFHSETWKLDLQP